MAIMSYEFFISDTFTYPEPSIAVATGKVDPPVGYLTRKVENCFHLPRKLDDVRDKRLELFASPISGSMQLHFDEASYDGNCYKYIKGLSTAALSNIWNIIERIYLTQSFDATMLDEDLSTAPMFNGYVPQSVFISSVKIPVDVKVGTTPTAIRVPSYIAFSFEYELVKTTFKIFISEEAFRNQYSVSVITSVLLPCHETYLLDPSKYKSIIESITGTSEFIFKDVDKGVQTENNTAVYIYPSRYLVRSTSYVFLPFGIMYKGKIPSTLKIREAIRDRLARDNYADDDAWQKLFPDLFVTAQFYIIPMFNNYTTRPARDIWPSIINFKSMASVITKVFPNMDAIYREEKAEVIMNGVQENFSIAIADPLNDKIFSLLELHPTYVYHLTQDPAFAHMEPHTKEFNIRFNECMYVVFGKTTASSSYSFNEYDGKRWCVFVSGKVEYYVLTEQDFPFDA